MLALLEAPRRSLPSATSDAPPLPVTPRGKWRERFAAPAAKRLRGPWVTAVGVHAAILGAGLAFASPVRVGIGEALHGCLVVQDASTPECEPTTTPVADDVLLPDATVEIPEVPPVDAARPDDALEPLEPEPDMPDAPADLTPPRLPASDSALVRQRIARPQPPAEPTRPLTVAAPTDAPAAPASAPSGRAQLRPRFRPAPPYPEALRRSGVEGVAALRIVIEADGTVSDAQVVESSGYEAFDAAAVETLRRWQFEPPGERRTVPSVPIRFRLR